MTRHTAIRVLLAGISAIAKFTVWWLFRVPVDDWQLTFSILISSVTILNRKG
jgi:hypothetical protein